MKIKCDFCNKEMNIKKYCWIDINYGHDFNDPTHYRICEKCYDKLIKIGRNKKWN